jgi:hypothetical protein
LAGTTKDTTQHGDRHVKPSYVTSEADLGSVNIETVGPDKNLNHAVPFVYFQYPTQADFTVRSNDLYDLII